MHFSTTFRIHSPRGVVEAELIMIQTEYMRMDIGAQEARRVSQVYLGFCGGGPRAVGLCSRSLNVADSQARGVYC